MAADQKTAIRICQVIIIIFKNFAFYISYFISTLIIFYLFIYQPSWQPDISLWQFFGPLPYTIDNIYNKDMSGCHGGW